MKAHLSTESSVLLYAFIGFVNPTEFRLGFPLGILPL